MDPTTTFCPIWRVPPEAKPARGILASIRVRTGASSARSVARPLPQRTGQPFIACARRANLVALIVTLLAHGCPVQAIVVAFGFDERTVAAWRARAGRQGQAVQEHLVEQPRGTSARCRPTRYASRAKIGIVWMALAMMVSTRLWLAGEVSEQRDMPLIRRLIERVRACALQRPLLWCTDGLYSSIRAMRETFRDPVRTGAHGRPRLRPWRNVCIAQVVKRYAQRRVVDVERRLVDGTPARVETLRRRAQGDGVINTASIERLNATFRERLASLTRRGRALARCTLTLQHGMYLIGTVYNFCTPHTSLVHAGGKTTPAMAAGITEHCWSVQDLLSYHVPPPRWTPPKHRGRPSHAMKRLMVRWCGDHG